MDKPTVSAKAKNVLISMKKALLVTEFVKGMDVNEALETLKYLNKKVALPLGKLIASAAANAEENKNWDIENLKIVDIQVGQGITYKRGRMGSRGHMRPILKRRSNITVVLCQKDAVSKPKVSSKKESKVKSKAKTAKSKIKSKNKAK